MIDGYEVGRKDAFCIEGVCTPGSTVLFACRPGYNMNGSAFSTCQESNEWYPTLGGCVPAPWSE